MNFKTVGFIGSMVLFTLQGCVEYRDDPACDKMNFMTFEEFRAMGIEVEEPKEIIDAGKIYIYNKLLFVAEKNSGVHVIDNSDKKNPIPKAFIKIYGNLDMAVKDGYLYLDSYMDLVVLDVRDLSKIKEVNRKNSTFIYDPYQSDFYRFNRCDFDVSKGIIVGENE